MPGPEALALGAGGAAGGVFIGAIAKAIADRWVRRGFAAVDGYPELAKDVQGLRETQAQVNRAVEVLTRRCDQLEQERGAAHRERDEARRERDEARRERDELRDQVGELRATTARLEAHVEALQEAVARSADRTEQSLQHLLDLVARGPLPVRSAR